MTVISKTILDMIRTKITIAIISLNQLYIKQTVTTFLYNMLRGNIEKLYKKKTVVYKKNCST